MISPDHVSPVPNSAAAGARLLRQQRALDRLATARATGTPAQITLAEQQVTLTHSALASALAHRYRDKGVETADLEQVAYLGLVKAAKGWDPGVAELFAPFAYVTILGELRRYFRDQLHTIRPPRPMAEINARAFAALPALEQRLGHHPRRAEVAAAIGIEGQELDAARTAATGCWVHSLDDPLVMMAALSSASTRTVGHESDTERRLMIADALSHLSVRQQQLVQWRFADQLTQREISQIIGVSQMQVSRLLSRVLNILSPMLSLLVHDCDLAATG